MLLQLLGCFGGAAAHVSWISRAQALNHTRTPLTCALPPCLAPFLVCSAPITVNSVTTPDESIRIVASGFTAPDKGVNIVAYDFGVVTYNDAQGVSYEDLAGSGSAPTFTYEALGPGKYSFFVVAYDSNGASKRADAAQNVTIVAPVDGVTMAHCLTATQLVNKVGPGDG